MTRPPLVVFSPLPPSRSGIADYCAEQLPGLAQDWEVQAVIADDAPTPDAIAGIAIHRRSAWRRAHGGDDGILRLYHHGNNPHHSFVLEEAEAHPGVAVLHDFLMHHLIAGMTLGRGRSLEYERYMEHDHGAVGHTLAQQRARHVFSEYQQFLLPLNGTALEGSRGVIVHSRASLDRIRYQYPDLPAVRIPHHYAPPAFSPDRAEARERLGLPADKTILCSLGFVTPPKQLELVFRALARVRHRLPPLEHWVVGQADDERGLANLAATHGLGDLVKHTGYVDGPTFYRFIAACDAVVNLRYPSAGETSGTLVRALGMGSCAIIFDYASFADYPEDVAIKIPLDTERTDRLEEALLRALADPVARLSIGARAGAYVAAEHAMPKCRDQYTRFLRLISDRPLGHRPHRRVPADPSRGSGPGDSSLYTLPPAFSSVETTAIVDALIADIDVGRYGAEALRYSRVHARRWAETMACVPRALPGMAALELGSYQVILPMLRHHLRFDYVAGADHDPTSVAKRLDRQLEPEGARGRYDLFLFDAESERHPFIDASFDLVLCCELIEHLTRDPMFLLSEVNRVLKRGGVLILTTPNVASARGVAAMLAGYGPMLYPDFNRNRSTNRHNIEYSVHQVAALLRAAGLEILRLETPDCWSERPAEVMELLARSGHPVELRGDNILAVAAKRTSEIERYPVEIYGAGESIHCDSARGPLPGPVEGQHG